MAVPSALLAPVTRPVALTGIATGLLDDQVTVRPVTVTPRLSVSVAVNCRVWPPSGPSLWGCTVTRAIGTGVTVMSTVSATAPLSVLAMSSARPSFWPTTVPSGCTVNTVGSVLR